MKVFEGKQKMIDNLLLAELNSVLALKSHSAMPTMESEDLGIRILAVALPRNTIRLRSMNKTRLEAFSDGIFAVIITIMVLEMKVPHEATMAAFMQLFPVFISYVVSFVVIGIYWVNHHHLFHTVKHVNTKILWANFVVLFPLTLVPFTTGWIGENYNEQLPMTIYCINLLLTGIGAGILQKVLMAGLPTDDAIRLIAKRNLKKVVFSSVIYLVSIATSFFYPAFCLVLIAIVAATWFIPDKEIERVLAKEN